MRGLFASEPASFLAVFVALSEGVSAASPSEDECGTRPVVNDITTDTRILGGHDAKVGAWPWNPEYWTAVVGLHHLYKQQAHTIYQRVSSIIVHSDFKQGSYENDIAIFKLLKSVKYNEYVQPICLPDVSHLVPDKNLCYISGWGKGEKKGELQLTLQEAQVDIIPLYTCNKYDWYKERISRNMICAGSASGHVDSCEGDGGGPLMCRFPNVTKYYLLGVTSSFTACGVSKHPGIYVRVVSYRNWIDSHLQDKTSTINIQCGLILLAVEWITIHLLI